VASRYGVSNVVDAYQLANIFMLWIPTTLGSALPVVLMPALISLKDNSIDRHLCPWRDGINSQDQDVS